MIFPPSFGLADPVGEAVADSATEPERAEAVAAVEEAWPAADVVEHSVEPSKSRQLPEKDPQTVSIGHCQSREFAEHQRLY